MPGIDKNAIFHPLNIALLTVSDTRTRRDDRSGDILEGRIKDAGHALIHRDIVSDDVEAIRGQLSVWMADKGVDVIITTGGTGFARRDVTPEAVRPMLDKVMDGFSTLFHQYSYGTVGLSTLQSRAMAGQAGDIFIFCLPGSPGACKDGWDGILAGELDSRYKPCSLTTMIPRLTSSS